MSLLFRLLSLFSFGLNFIWIKKTVWTGQNLKCLVLFSVLLRRYWEKASGRNRRLAEIGDLQESCLNAERTDSTCRGDSPFLYLKSSCLIE